jgi:hypothetical protein
MLVSVRSGSPSGAVCAFTQAMLGLRLQNWPLLSFPPQE